MSLPGLFVVGTDTGVGKTRVASSIAALLTESGRRVGVLKPVATGAIREGDSWRCEDAEALSASVGGTVPIERVVPLLFEEPLAPCVAARRDGQMLMPADLDEALENAIAWWTDRAEVLIIEGVGGLLCPLAEGTTVADLAISLDFPLLVVARRGLGTLNHTLMTVECARARSLRVAGIVLNSPEPESVNSAEATNAEELARRLPGLAILAESGHGADLTSRDALRHIDWYELAGMPRPRPR